MGGYFKEEFPDELRENELKKKKLKKRKAELNQTLNTLSKKKKRKEEDTF